MRLKTRVEYLCSFVRETSHDQTASVQGIWFHGEDGVFFCEYPTLITNTTLICHDSRQWTMNVRKDREASRPWRYVVPEKELSGMLVY